MRKGEGQGRKRPRRELTFIENLLLWAPSPLFVLNCLARTARSDLKLIAVVPELDCIDSHPGT